VSENIGGCGETGCVCRGSNVGCESVCVYGESVLYVCV